MHEALFYAGIDDQRVVCGLCPHACIIAPGRKGRCGVRENRDGILYSLVYGKPVSINLDPIEKKPFYHFLPGSSSLSIATVGCNLTCRFCQNYSISQINAGLMGADHYAPQEIIAAAQEQGARTIACTYTEPTIYFEYARDIGLLAREAHIKTLFVSNGFMSQVARDMCPEFVDGINIDLKCFCDDTYKRIMGGRLQPVLDSIAWFHAQGIWVEITTLIVPGMNDTAEELGELAAFIAEISPDIPWHVSRFHPTYQMLDRGPTPVGSINLAIEAGEKAGLQNVYAGNVPGHAGADTICPACNAVIISRYGFSADISGLNNGSCADCGHIIPGVW